MATKPRIPIEYRDASGRAIPNASVTVYNAGTTTLSTIYDPNDVADATITIANPQTTDSAGRALFAVAQGAYTVVIAGGSSATLTIPYLCAVSP